MVVAQAIEILYAKYYISMTCECLKFVKMKLTKCWKYITKQTYISNFRNIPQSKHTLQNALHKTHNLVKFHTYLPTFRKKEMVTSWTALKRRSAQDVVFERIGMTSLYTLMGLSIERWLIITRPGKFSLNSYATTWIIISSAWILSLMTALPPLFGWAYYAPETSGMT